MAASKVQLLLAAVWVAFALAASQVAAHSLEISKTNPVCIIGAGPAGISAATALRQAEIPLVVIEGRARPGGRIWSSAALGKGVNGNEPVTIDLGAGWLEGDGAGSPVYNVVKPFLTDAHTVVSDFDQGEQYYVEGGEVTVDPMAGWTAVEDKIEAEQAAGDDVDPTLATLLARAEAGMTAGNKLKTEWQATVNIIDEIGADPSQLSGWNYDSAANAPGERRLWKHGYFSAFRPLLNGLNVTYSTKVTGISLPSGGSSVLVATSKGQYRCSRVVLTVPLGVMKANRIAITPALPAPKLSAIKRLGMGTFNKIALRFPPSAYDLLPDATAHFLTFVPKTFSSTNVRRGFYDWINFKSVRPAVKNPVLVCIAAGTFGKSIESLTNAAIVSKIMPQLRASFPGLPNPIAVAVTRWASDPFTLGSYSFMAPGTSSVEYTELGKPINTASGVPWLQLAGEAYGSWPYPSTVHGAWKAGAAAAQKIIATEDLE